MLKDRSESGVVAKRCNRIIWAVSGLMSLFLSAAISAAPVAISVTPDKADPIYSIDQPVIFTVNIKANGKSVDHGRVDYTITKDVGGPELAKGTIKVQNDAHPLTIPSRLNEPGMIFCTVTYFEDAAETTQPSNPTQKSTASAGVAVDPLAIKPSMPAPDDFDAFWNGWKKKLSDLPMNAKMKPVKVDEKYYPNVEIFDVTLDCVGPKPVRAYVGWPKNAKTGSCPAIVNYYCYSGLNPGSIDWVAIQAAKGCIALDVNAHGIELGQKPEYYTQVGNELGWFPAKGQDSRDHFYFLWMYLRDWRALQYVKSLPQWDTKVLIVTGSSMGGGQAIALGGLESQVSLVVANVPAMCDHSGFKVGRVSGWARQAATAPTDQQETILRTLRYFDGVNFASRIKGRFVVSCGFIDGTCPPTSIYAAFNAVTLPSKKMVHVPTMGHEYRPQVQTIFQAAIDEHIQAVHPTTSKPASSN